MLATLGEPPSRFADFAVEAKYDGQRGMAVIADGAVTLFSRNGANITGTFPEISAALPALSNRNLVLDGEIVALNEAGIPSFRRLQQRWPQHRRPNADLLQQVPVKFFVFDALKIAGVDLTRQPYEVRRARLTDIASDAGPVVQLPGSWAGVDPHAVLAASADLQLEGIVTKHLASPYTPGLRSRDWIKTPHRKRSEFIIGGWLPGAGVNRNTVGALLVGAHNADGELQFCGLVGAGLSSSQRRHLSGALEPLRSVTTPFTGLVADAAAHARWVRPELVGDVEYREFGTTLRHPSWRGFRTDIDSAHVTLPTTA
jgi:bifunctional non-homologous end joining protein LigD